MSLTLKDDQITKLANFIADYFVKRFSKNKFSPKEFIADFDDSVRIFKGQVLTKATDLWQTTTGSPREVTRDFDDVITFIQTIDKTTPEEKLVSLLPEEKIICNQKVFRGILDDVSFDKLTTVTEKNLLNRLKTEAVGLNDQEIYIYYNLIKLTSNTSSGPISENTDHIRHDLSDTLEEAVQNLSDNFIDVSSIKHINDNTKISVDNMINSLEFKIKQKKISLPVLLLLSGGYEDNDGFVMICKKYLMSVCTKWGTSVDEAFSYYVVYLLFSSLDDQQFTDMGISRILKNFLIGEVTKVKPIIAVSIRFIYLFLMILASQVIEINKKYKACSPTQQQKLIKLYKSSDRRNMLVSNAATFAFQRTSAQKSEFLETEKIFKMFLVKNSPLLSVNDLFNYEY